MKKDMKNYDLNTGDITFKVEHSENAENYFFNSEKKYLFKKEVQIKFYYLILTNKNNYVEIMKILKNN